MAGPGTAHADGKGDVRVCVCMNTRIYVCTSVYPACTSFYVCIVASQVLIICKLRVQLTILALPSPRSQHATATQTFRQFKRKVSGREKEGVRDECTHGCFVFYVYTFFFFTTKGGNETGLQNMGWSEDSC